MLRLLNAGVAKHQLNDPDVNGVREQPTRALVTQVVPAEIDSSVDCRVHRLERAMTSPPAACGPDPSQDCVASDVRTSATLRLVSLGVRIAGA